MIKCVHDSCCWPHCNKSCGMVPTDNNNIEGGLLIRHLQDQLVQTKADMASVRSTVQQIAAKVSHAAETLSTGSYERVCPYGYMDCVYDPGYLRKYHLSTWAAMGMPISCGETCGGKDGGYCNKYDWEDK